MLWDEENLHILFTVNDSTRNPGWGHVQGTNPGINWDTIELYIDPLHLGGEYSQRNGVRGIITRGSGGVIGSGNELSQNRWNAAARSDHFNIETREVSGGYQIKMSISLRRMFLAFRFEPGRKFGIDFQINDNATGNNRTHATGWNDHQNIASNDNRGLSHLGVATLVGLPAMPQLNVNTAAEWAKNDIAMAIGKGFAPMEILFDFGRTITRGEFCRMAMMFIEYKSGSTIAEILAGRETSNVNFTDTSDPYILAAAAIGITTGTGAGTFTPDGELNREQAATFLARVAAFFDAVTTTAPESGFADFDKVSDWARASVNYVADQEIMRGVGENRFDPQAAYTREQSIVTFNRMD